MYKAVIFDMNGVIINDERIHQESWRRLLRAHNIHLLEEEFTQNVFGRTEKEVLAWVFKKDVTPQKLEDFSNERINIVIEIFRPMLEATPGFLEFLHLLESISIKRAVATSSRNRYKDFIVHGLHIQNHFDVIVTAEDIQKGKPDPEIYLKTAGLLGITPNDCLVFEDSISGIASAKAAGMKVVGITTTHSEEELQEADFIIKSFEGIGITDFTNNYKNSIQ